MATQMKAIQTSYKGYRFRSRLEARWAVVFDHLGLKWTYESQGYQLPSGRHYLPDFRVSKAGNSMGDFAVEVKGDTSLLDYGLIVGFARSCRSAHIAGLLILSDIPEPVRWELPGPPAALHPFYYTCGPDGPQFYDECQDESAVHMKPVELASDGLWTMPLGFGERAIGYPWAENAFRAGREARFEHGETPS